MSNKFNFTKRDIEKVELPEAGKRAYYWDTLVAGLALDVTGSGTKIDRLHIRILAMGLSASRPMLHKSWG